MAERIRSNSSAGAAYALDPDAAASLPSPPCELSTPSDAATRAACDLAEWQQDVARALPGAVASLIATSVAGTDASLYIISLRWTAPGARDRGSFTLRVQA
jgi:hypothetical protein